MLQVGFSQPCVHGTHATLTACHPSATFILQLRQALTDWLNTHASALHAAQMPLVESLQSDAPSLGWHSALKPLLAQWRVAPSTEVLLGLARATLPLPSLTMWAFVAAEVQRIDRWLLPEPQEALSAPRLPSSLPIPFHGDAAAAAVLAAVIQAQGGNTRLPVNPQEVVAVIDNHCYPVADAAVQVWTASSNALARLSRCAEPVWTDSLVAPAFSRYSPLVLPVLQPQWTHYYAVAGTVVHTPSSRGSPCLESLTPRPAAKSHFPPPSPSARSAESASLASLVSDALPATPALSALSLHSSPALAPIHEHAPLARLSVDVDMLPQSPLHAHSITATPRRASHPPSARACTPRMHSYAFADYERAPPQVTPLKVPTCPTPTGKSTVSPIHKDTCSFAE